MKRNQPRLAELGLTDSENAFIEINVFAIQIHRFCYPHTCDSQQTEDR